MADVALQLTARYVATKRRAYSTEVVTTDGGAEHRNARWSASLSEWDVTIPACKRSSADYLALIALFEATLGSLRSFTFHDKVACLDFEVRFVDDEINVTPVGNLVEASFAVRQVRLSGDSP